MISAIEHSFDKSKVFLPVIHYYDDEQFWKNIEIAYKYTDGVWLITQGRGMYSDKLCRFAEEMRGKLPTTFFIGVNFLRDNIHAFELVEKMGCVFDGLWTDNGYVYDDNRSIVEADNFARLIEESDWNGLYFGGTAFKYQRKVFFLEYVTRVACDYMHVVTTSGPGTGQSANIEKIKLMRKVIDDHSGYSTLSINDNTPQQYRPGFALASGVTVENIGTYLPYVDAFMVGTGIEKEFGILDEDKVREMSRLIYEYRCSRIGT